MLGIFNGSPCAPSQLMPPWVTVSEERQYCQRQYIDGMARLDKYLRFAYLCISTIFLYFCHSSSLKECQGQTSSKSSDLLKFLIDCQSPQRLVTLTDICQSLVVRKGLKMILNVSKKRITFYIGDARRHLPIISRKGLQYISLDECRIRSHGKDNNLKILTISENTLLPSSV